ncbi:MAG: hypothetical protein IKJ28_04680 [Alphaproteobacteria bacterium]|nr:hypothetical protein [Alphaproteobacteria bacterium]
MPNNCITLYNRAKNDIPYDSEEVNRLLFYLDNSDIQTLPFVFIDACNLKFDLYYPGKPKRHYDASHPDAYRFLINLLDGIRKRSKSDGYPVVVRVFSIEIKRPDNPAKLCRWCGAKTDKLTFNTAGALSKTPAFCCEECREKFKRFKELLKKLVRQGLISEEEMKLRLEFGNVIENTEFYSQALVERLTSEVESQLYLDSIEFGNWRDETTGKYEVDISSLSVDKIEERRADLNALPDYKPPHIPIISTDILTVVNDEVIAETDIKTCGYCGKVFFGRKNQKYCCSSCRTKDFLKKN